MSAPAAAGTAATGMATAGPAATVSAVSDEVLARAARAARAGRYQEAHGILAEFGGAGSDDPAVLDLLARLHAQRGELAEADACWARVLDVSLASSPSSHSARAGRRRIAALQAGRLGVPAGRRLAAGVLLLAAGAAVAGTVLLPSTSHSRTADPDLAAIRAQQSGLTRQLDQLHDELTARTPSPAPAEPSGPSPQDVAADLDGPATTVTRQRDGLLITFDAGLFAAGVTLTPDGAGALADLGRRLGQADLGGPVVVTGHTDDTPLPVGGPYTDRVNLGFARAQTAAEELSADSGVPLPSIGIRSTGTAAPPFSNDSAAGRARNNTVTVLVSLHD